MRGGWNMKIVNAPAYRSAAAAARSLQSCPTLCDPIDGSPPGSAVPGILWARTLGWVAISFSNAWKWKEKVKPLCRVWLFATPWTAAYQAPLPMGLSRQEYWSWLPLPSPAYWSDSLYSVLTLNIWNHKMYYLICLLSQELNRYSRIALYLGYD